MPYLWRVIAIRFRGDGEHTPRQPQTYCRKLDIPLRKTSNITLHMYMNGVVAASMGGPATDKAPLATQLTSATTIRDE